MRIPQRLSIVGFALLNFVLPLAAFADATLDPYEVKSPDGSFVLSVNPSHRNGSGKAEYKFSQGGQVVWQGERPYTLWAAAITDAGTVCGYGYGKGYEGRAGFGDSDNDVLCVVMDKSGTVRAQDAHPRKFPNILSNPPAPAEPTILGLTLDALHDRFIVRAAGSWDDDAVRWWRYTLSTGESLGEVVPEQPRKVPGESGFHKELTAELIPGMPLLLVHWYIYKAGGRFALLDQDGKEVWSLEQEGEYAGLGAQFSWYWDLVEKGIVQTEVRPGGFDIVSYSLGARLTYEVTASAEDPPKYAVREVKRVDERPHPRADKTAGALAEMNLEPCGTIELQAPAPSSPIDDFHEFNFDAAGRIGLVRWAEGGQFRFVLVKPDGEVAVDKALDLPEHPKARAPVTAPVGANRWIIVRGFYDRAAPTEAWWLDVDTKELAPVKPFDGSAADSACPVVGGGFACVGKFGDTDAVTVFDSNAARVGAVQTKDVGMVQSATVRTDGTIAILVPVSNTIDSFDAHGTALGSVALAGILPHPPNYPSEIRMDQDGGLLLEDFNGSPPVFRLTADNKVRAEITPKYANGATFRPIGGVRCAPDGTLWTNDAHALLRLDANGVVDRVLGPDPTSDDFSTPGSVAVGPDGMIYAADRRTSVIHVFDSSGRRVRVCHPAPGDFGNTMPAEKLTVAANGTVWACSRSMASWSAERYIGFATDGQRQEPRHCSLDPITEAWHFQPKGPLRWVLGYQQIWLVNEADEPVRTITHRPSGAWLGHVYEGAVGSDGSLAVVTGTRDMGMRGPAVLNLFAPMGDPVKSIPLPDKWVMMRVALTSQWAITADDTELHLFNLTTGVAGRFNIPDQGKGKHYWCVSTSPDGQEVWVRDSDSKIIRRFKLPA